MSAEQTVRFTRFTISFLDLYSIFALQNSNIVATSLKARPLIFLFKIVCFYLYIAFTVEQNSDIQRQKVENHYIGYFVVREKLDLISFAFGIKLSYTCENINTQFY